MHDLRQRHCPISTPTHCKRRVATAWLTHHTAHIRRYCPSGFCPCGAHGPRSLAQNLRSASRGLMGGAGQLATGRSPNLSKVGATARNARCEADNFNPDRSAGSRRGAVVTAEAREMPCACTQVDISKSAFAPHQQTFFSASSMSEKCHVWTAPSWQGLSSRAQAWVSAAMCSACRCGSRDRWP
jgi:hypothetical protein